MTGKNIIKYRGRLLREDRPLAFEEKCKHIGSTTPRLLALLHKYNTKLTFFVTGRLYEACPEVINDIYREGHEIGWHGHYHRPILEEKTLIEDLHASEEFICKYKPKGFRAPWVLFRQAFLPILIKAGFDYDSSVFGPAGSQYTIHGMRVYPVTSFPNFGYNKPLYTTSSRYLNVLKAFPVGSNFIFSLLRYRYDYLLRLFGERSRSCIFYIHNWQVFPWPEREMSVLRDKLRYVQKFSLSDVIQHLLCNHRFHRMDTMLSDMETFKGHYLSFDME